MRSIYALYTTLFCEAYFEPLAQLVEHLTFNQVVGGSIPPWHIIFIWWVWRSWLARQIVALEAEGSSPSTHPSLYGSNSNPFQSYG